MCSRNPISRKEAMDALNILEKFCDEFDDDNTNRIEKTHEELGLPIEEWRKQHAIHINQIKQFHGLRLLLTGVAKCLSKITHRQD